MRLILYLAVGGVAGTLARYGIGTWVPTWAGTGFPWGTFIINASGSLLLGFALRAFEISPVSPEARALVSVGLCGAFTTFSTFSYETVRLLQDGLWARGAAYAFGSLAVGLVAVCLGMSLASATVHAGG